MARVAFNTMTPFLSDKIQVFATKMLIFIVSRKSLFNSLPLFPTRNFT